MVFCSTPTFFCYSSNSPSIGYSVMTLHPSIFVCKGILLILLLFQKNMHYWLKGMWNLANNA